MGKINTLMNMSIPKWFYLNHVWHGNHGVDIRPIKGTCLVFDKTFVLQGDGTVTFNADRFKHGKMYTYFSAAADSKFTVNGSCHFCYGCDIKLFPGAELLMNDCSLNSYSQIRCMNHISIGKNTRISRNVQIWDGDFHKIVGSTNSKKGVIIDDNVWVGAGAIILKGVHIGEGSMIAAGAVVTSDIPEDCVAAGVPAKVIRKDFKWEF